jgi:hypothetical protein
MSHWHPASTWIIWNGLEGSSLGQLASDYSVQAGDESGLSLYVSREVDRSRQIRVVFIAIINKGCGMDEGCDLYALLRLLY